MITSARSATPPPPTLHQRNDEAGEHGRERSEADRLPPSVGRRAERQLDAARASGYWNGDEGVISSKDLSGNPVYRGSPVYVPILRDKYVAGRRGNGVQL